VLQDGYLHSDIMGYSFRDSEKYLSHASCNICAFWRITCADRVVVREAKAVLLSLPAGKKKKSIAIKTV